MLTNTTWKSLSSLCKYLHWYIYPPKNCHVVTFSWIRSCYFLHAFVVKVFKKLKWRNAGPWSCENKSNLWCRTSSFLLYNLLLLHTNFFRLIFPNLSELTFLRKLSRGFEVATSWLKMVECGCMELWKLEQFMRANFVQNMFWFAIRLTIAPY